MVRAVWFPSTLEMATAFILRMYCILPLRKLQNEPGLPLVFLLLPPHIPTFPQCLSKLWVNQMAVCFEAPGELKMLKRTKFVVVYRILKD